MNSETSKTSDPYTLIVNLADKMNLRRSDITLNYQTLIFNMPIKTINLEYQVQHETINLNCLIGHVLAVMYRLCSSCTTESAYPSQPLTA